MITDWGWYTFAELSGAQVYGLLALRQEVFVLEQQCLYHDIDGRDDQAQHLLGTGSAGQVLAYLRVLPPGVAAPHVAIGRVVTHRAARGHGAGRALMARGVAWAEEHYPGQAIFLAAQHHLASFYASFGFVATGEPYIEDGIPHVDMLRQPSSEF
jgi:ElaA protein